MVNVMVLLFLASIRAVAKAIRSGVTISISSCPGRHVTSGYSTTVGHSARAGSWHGNSGQGGRGLIGRGNSASLRLRPKCQKTPTTQSAGTPNTRAQIIRKPYRGCIFAKVGGAAIKGKSNIITLILVIAHYICDKSASYEY
jgi:hypothetical protein